jgi:2,3-bisphosphoglycerate-independent phosphoglycerate mutase
MTAKKKVMLIVLDGLGAAPAGDGNAVVKAKPEHLSSLWTTNPHTYLLASGEAVGLPANVKGNSEVGHLSIGAGSLVNQNLPRIDKAIERGYLDSNVTLNKAIEHAEKNKSNIHLMGCLSDGAVHAHINHFSKIVDYIAKKNFSNHVYIHAFTDGRDTPPNSAKLYIDALEMHCKDVGLGTIASICGRYFAMDRNRQWDRTEKTFKLLTEGSGTKYSSYQQAISSNYETGFTDEFIQPSLISTGENPLVKDNDAIIFMNFRADRAIQLSEAFLNPQFNKFKRKGIKNFFFASMMEYKKDFPSNVIFPKQYIHIPLGKIVSTHGLRQLRIAESEKFPHVTYFFNGGMNFTYKGEDRIKIESPKVATYDLKPEMNAEKVTKTLLGRIQANMYDFILLNFANPDMVGHTGDMDATIKAVSTVDYYTNSLVKAFVANGGTVIITADHGNAEELLNTETGKVDTEHSINPVPLIIVDPSLPKHQLPYGALKDIAPTVLHIMGIPQPSEMTGRSLLRGVI